MEFTKKHYGILKKFDFDNININTFKTLISSGVFIEHELSECYKYDEDYFTSDSDIMEFGDFFIQNRKEYHLKKDIYTEMVHLKEFIFKFGNIEHLTEKIEVMVVSEFLLENKLKILEENFKKYFNQIEDKQYYSLYKNQTPTGGYESWEEYFISDIVDNENYISVVKFLKGDSKFLNNEIENQWNDYFVFSKISDYCEQKRKELLNIKTENILENKSKNIDLSFQLAIIESIMKIENWEGISANKKGKILTHLLGKHVDNIKDYYLELDKKTSNSNGKFFDKSGKYQTDKLKAEKIITELLG